MNHNRICHIIVAAGTGSRFGASIPKQFAPLSGRPVLMTTIERMRTGGRGGYIIIVLHPDWIEPWKEMCSRYQFDSPVVTAGGASRWESVRNALAHIPADTDVVTVHDGARPLLTSRVIDGVLDAVADGAPGAIPAVEVTDSLRFIDDDGTSRAIDRSRYRAVQTPQAFRADILIRAYAHDRQPHFTDDASVVESAFPDVRLALTPGDPSNIKITHPYDLEQAARILAEIDR